ncbi:hypothetical protein CLV51_1021164 [Chitinophaga niastensis]|uniref:DinB family protein n=1 Tax=Chitinophaga niastensis TaxID=536980 RepID=A0A2P8HQ16_CHINA|nr:hypothetical protein [Chitinophaga niastensis]PSL48297.1 hypothetical protein CLV51_1021164 [Chitinophaga niastensis]
MTQVNEILKHSINAIEYRFIKATAGSKDNFGDYKISDHTRSPNEIINHMYDLATKTKTMIKEGHFNCPVPESLKFEDEVKRFLSAIKELEAVIANSEISIEISKKLLQGPILDMATHIGQIAMLNGLNGNKITKESYFAADLDSPIRHLRG